MFVAPTMIRRLLDCAAECDPARIRTLISGGAPLYVEDAIATVLGRQGHSVVRARELVWTNDLAVSEARRIADARPALKLVYTSAPESSNAAASAMTRRSLRLRSGSMRRPATVPHHVGPFESRGKESYLYFRK